MGDFFQNKYRGEFPVYDREEISGNTYGGICVIDGEEGYVKRMS